MLKEFYSQGKFEKRFNATFVSLIPKKARAVEIKYFHPISLVGGCTKLFLKYWQIG